MTQIPRSVMLFTAGFGTRMGDLTKDVPKPLIKVAGRPLVDHALDLARDISPDKIVANTHYRAQQMADHLKPLGVQISQELPAILETGGGLKAALPLLGSDPVFTMNTDMIWIGPNPLRMLLKAWDANLMDALLMCVPTDSTVGHNGGGDFELTEDGKISRGGDYVYGGVQIIKTEQLADFDQDHFSLNQLWNWMQKNERLYACRYPGKWCDVGHPEGVKLAEAALRNSNV